MNFGANLYLWFKVVKANQLSTKEVNDLYSLRLRNIQLKTDCDHDYDRVVFNDILCKRSACVVQFFDFRNILQGFYIYTPFEVAYKERGAFLLVLEFLFFEKRARGSSALVISFIYLGLYFFIQNIFRPIFWGSICYPNSYILYGKLAGPCITLDRVKNGSLEEIVLLKIGQEFGSQSFNKNTGVDVLRTIPFDISNKKNLGTLGFQLLADYENLNPNWKSGLGLTTVVDGSMSHMARHFMKIVYSIIYRNYRQLFKFIVNRSNSSVDVNST